MVSDFVFYFWTLRWSWCFEPRNYQHFGWLNNVVKQNHSRRTCPDLFNLKAMIHTLWIYSPSDGEVFLVFHYRIRPIQIQIVQINLKHFDYKQCWEDYQLQSIFHSHNISRKYLKYFLSKTAFQIFVKNTTSGSTLTLPGVEDSWWASDTRRNVSKGLRGRMEERHVINIINMERLKNVKLEL